METWSFLEHLLKLWEHRGKVMRAFGIRGIWIQILFFSLREDDLKPLQALVSSCVH